ncbi:ribonucleotide reductase inhibitor-domain-containing protein [Clohesyomyces aquaticus]|uniref:Ribonucleotide reductase inhibitor-domain-containing protein n=1 Tax=Clohesyomyces aquaticus TaxID=1231657 RepID=A0A1Y1ZU93_9PLEO|nr:ribonucleotide reductase inhibitor-domain-containing protein [Clohesyomyces aquaticus]
MRQPSSPSTSHRDKRPFQPSITHFFARDASDEADEQLRGAGPVTRSQHHAKGKAARDSVIPAVPATVQANLLSVGMRVRKSVPEGYKTHKTPAMLPSIQTTIASRTTPIANASATSGPAGAYSVKPPREPVPDVLQHQRELLPFCGLHKIGGFAEQPVTNVHLYAGADAQGNKPANLFPLPAEAFNTPFSSQGTTLSSISTESAPPNPANPYKRSYEEEEDGKPLNMNTNFLFAYPVQVSEDEVPVSPLSATPSHSINMLPQAALRPFAQPKTRRQIGARIMDVDGGLLKEQDMDMDLENAAEQEVRVVGSSSDFGEADFLRPWNGREVEMGDV